MKRIAVVGAGWMAHMRARALLGTGQVDVCGVATRHAETARRFGAEIGCSACFDDYRQLAGLKPDAILVEVPHAVQDEVVLWALEQGLHTFIGGTLATTSAAGERIRALAERNRLIVEAGYDARYSRMWARAQRMLAGGELGRLVMARSIALWPGDPSTWYYRQEDSGGMPLTHMTYCFINPLRWLLGRVRCVSAFANRVLNTAAGLVNEENCVASLLFDGDVLASVTAGFVKPAEAVPGWSVTLIGTQAAVELLPNETGVDRMAIYRGRQAEEIDFAAEPRSFDLQAQAFVNALNGNDDLRNTPAQAIDDLRIAEAIVAAARDRSTIAL